MPKHFLKQTYRILAWAMFTTPIALPLKTSEKLYISRNVFSFPTRYKPTAIKMYELLITYNRSWKTFIFLSLDTDIVFSLKTKLDSFSPQAMHYLKKIIKA